MKKEELSRLLQRYLSSHKEGKDAYFDADEIDELLDSFEESDDYTHYDKVLALGLRLHPGNADLQIRKCKLYVYNEEYDSALALIDTIAETENQDLDLLRLECYCMLDEYNKVVEFTEELIKKDCEYLEILFENIAPILSDEEMYNEARDYIDRGLLLFPDNMILKDELCYNYEVAGDMDKAIELCNELIDKNPYSYDYWFTLGRLHSIKGDYEKAIEAFDFALTCDDSDDELKILKAYCLYMNENYEKAIEVYKEIPLNEDTQPRIVPLLAECHIKMEDYEKAYGLLSDLIKQKNKQEEASTYINYIRCCVETEREAEASQMLIRASEIFPDNIRILSLLALGYLETGNDKKAMEMTDRLFEIIDQVEEKQPEDLESLYRAGQYLFMKGDYDKAIKYYKKVFEADQEIEFIHLHMAMAYLSKGDMKHFAEHMQRTSPDELLRYMEKSGLNMGDAIKEMHGNYIPPEKLAQEFLKNKDNKN